PSSASPRSTRRARVGRRAPSLARGNEAAMARSPWFVFCCGTWLLGCGTRIEVAGAPDSGTPPHDGSASMDDEPDVTPTFPTGVFDCTSSLSATGSYSGEKYVSAAGGNGTLTV